MKIPRCLLQKTLEGGYMKHIIVCTLIVFCCGLMQFPNHASSPPRNRSLATELFPDLNGLIEEGEYEAFYTNTDQDWSFFYTIVGDTIKGGIVARTNGWCAIGLDPEIKMKGADIIQGSFAEPYGDASDSFGTKEFGPHPLDTDLGGTNNIQYFAISTQQDWIHFEFRRKLDTEDPFDKPFPTKGNLSILWSYGESQNPSSIHTHRGYGSLEQIQNAIRSTSLIGMKKVHDSLSSFQILDSSDQYAREHIQNALSCPHDELSDILPSLDHTKPTVLYGGTEDETMELANNLLYLDFREVYILDGTLEQWISEGYPTDKGDLKSITMRFYIGLKDYFVNRKKISMDVAPTILQSRTFLPIVYIVKPIGGIVQWTAESKKITIELNDTTIECWIGKNIALVNGKEHSLDKDNPSVVPQILPPGRTFVPVRFVAESLGCEVSWNPQLQEITIQYTLPE
jgi:rhodanese-related sulfurtransferase